MLVEPALAAPQQLFELVLAEPVVLVVVEHRDQYGELAQDILHPRGRTEGHAVGRAGSPFRELLVQWEPNRFDTVVTERLEQALQHHLATPAAEGAEFDFERNRGIGKLGPFTGLPEQRAPEDVADRDAQQRRRDVWAVVDVLGEGKSRRAGSAPDEPDRVDLDLERGCASGIRGLGVIDVRLAE